MKTETLNNWSKDFRHDGLLFFSQRINEMLFHYTDHILKAPVLNTLLLVDEYIKTAKLVKSGLINDYHLKQIMEEFQDTFNKDIIIKENLNENEKNYILHSLNSSTNEVKVQMMEYVRYVLKDYNGWCKKYIKEIVPQEKEKKKIENALRSYIPGLIAAGYSHEFIYFYNIEVFSKNTVTSLDSLDIFLNRFDFRNKNYSVYIAIVKEAIKFQMVLEHRLKVDFGPFEDELDFKYDYTQYHLTKVQIRALDEQSAAWNAYNQLNIFFRYYCFLAEQKDSWFFATAKVTNENHVASFVHLKDDGFIYSKSKERDQVAKNSEIFISLLITNARQSYFQINRALMAHNIAINDSDIRNKFLNLWSTLEIIFVSEQNDSKISEIQNKAIPILQKDYLHFIFENIKKDINDVVDNKVLNEIIESLEPEDQKYGIYYIIALNKYDGQRKKIYMLLSNYPLIRSRISQLNELCSNKKKILNCINGYVQRIKWHITRLYRTRNAMIHSGEQPDYLRELVEHLHSYSDECLFELIGLLSLFPQLKTISNTIIDVQFRIANMTERLKGEEAVNKEDIDYLLKLY